MSTGTLGVTAAGTQAMTASSSVVTIPLSTGSSTSSNGAFVVTGGVGVGGNVNTGGNVNVASGMAFEINGINAISFPTTDSTAGGSIAIGYQALSQEPSLASTAFGNGDRISSRGKPFNDRGRNRHYRSRYQV